MDVVNFFLSCIDEVGGHFVRSADVVDCGYIYIYIASK